MQPYLHFLKCKIVRHISNSIIIVMKHNFVLKNHDILASNEYSPIDSNLCHSPVASLNIPLLLLLPLLNCTWLSGGVRATPTRDAAIRVLAGSSRTPTSPSTIIPPFTASGVPLLRSGFPCGHGVRCNLKQHKGTGFGRISPQVRCFNHRLWRIGKDISLLGRCCLPNDVGLRGWR